MMLLKAKKKARSGFTFNNIATSVASPRITLRALPGKTAEVEVIDNYYNRTVTGTAVNSGGTADFFVNDLSAKIKRLCTVNITRPENVRLLALWYVADSFPIIVGMPNISEIQFQGCTFTDMDSPYLDTLKISLKTVYSAGLPMAAYSNAGNYNFWSNLKNVETFSIFQTATAITNELTWLNDLPKLRILNITQTTAHATATTLIDNIEHLTALTTVSFANYSQVLVANVYSRLVGLLLLKNITFYNCFRSTAKVDAFINATYDLCITHNVTNLIMNVRTGMTSGAWPTGEVAFPSGSYNGTTDWVGGLPTSPLAKIWHLENSKGHNWGFDGK